MKKCILLLITILGLLVTETKATHVMGSDIIYECLGNDKYKITLKIYRDCTGINLGGITGTISSDSFSTNFSPTKKGIRDITPTCASSVSACKNQQSGLGIGVEEHTYEATIDISKAPYTSWILKGACEFSFSWSQCCRNGEITTGFSNKSFYSEAKLNICNIKKTKVLCNTSPTFKGVPIFFACCNNPFKYNYQASERIDNDSLSYKLVAPMSHKDTNLTYNTPFSDTVPMTPKCTSTSTFNCAPVPNANPPLGFYLNKINGDLIFTPTKCDEVGIVVVEITEWRRDSSGTYLPIGTIRRDMQIIVMNCGSNWPPEVKSSKYDYTVCEGDNIKITIEGLDKPHPADPNGRKDTVSLSWDSAIAPAKFKVANPNSREKKAEFEWQTKIGDASSSPYQFGITATDDACPLQEQTTKGYSILVLPRAKGNRIYNSLCVIKGLEVEISTDSNFAGPATYFWELLDSNLKPVANSVYKKDTFKNLKNGKHYVKLTLKNRYACTSIIMDTLELKFNTKAKTINLGNDTTITDKDSLLLNAGIGFPSYVWNDNSTLQTLLVEGPKVKAGQFIYFVQAKDSAGCSYRDSIQIIITSTIGINDWNKENLLIYPTPTKDNLQIELPSTIKNGEVKIFNTEGKVVWSKLFEDYKESKLNLNVSHLAKGLYIIQLEANSNIFNAKMMKE